eukprot:5747073-Prymnesium_polylepis.2
MKEQKSLARMRACDALHPIADDWRSTMSRPMWNRTVAFDPTSRLYDEQDAYDDEEEDDDKDDNWDDEVEDWDRVGGPLLVRKRSDRAEDSLRE